MFVSICILWGQVLLFALGVHLATTGNPVGYAIAILNVLFGYYTLKNIIDYIIDYIKDDIDCP